MELHGNPIASIMFIAFCLCNLDINKNWLPSGSLSLSLSPWAYGMDVTTMSVERAHAQKTDTRSSYNVYLKLFLSSHSHTASRVWRREKRTWPKFERKLRKLNYEIKENNTQLHINLLRNTGAAAAAAADSADQPNQACLKVLHFLSSSWLVSIHCVHSHTFLSLFDFLFFRCSILCCCYKVFFYSFIFLSYQYFFPEHITSNDNSTPKVLGRLFFVVAWYFVLAHFKPSLLLSGLLLLL